MKYTLEQKIDICPCYIAATDPADINASRKLAIEAMMADASPAEIPVRNTPNVDVDDMIEDLLNEIGVPPHLTGYRAIRYALRLILSDHEYLHDITARLYSDVAKLIGPDYTISKTERVIRHAIEVIFNRNDFEILQSIFGNTISIHRGKLTNTEFLASCELVLRRRMKNRGVNV